MSTFFQQALDYHTKWTSSGEATVPIAQNMLGEGSGTLFYDNEQVWTDNFDTALQFAPYKAIYSPLSTNFTATATCATSNCTWQSFETLAVCNTCVNLSSRLDKTRIEVSAPIKAYDLYTNYYTLPNGFSLTGIQPQSVGSQAMHDGVLNMTTSRTANYSVPGEVVVYWDSVAFKDSGSKLISLFAIGPAPNSIPEQPDAAFLPQHSLEMSGSPQFTPPIAFECLLQFCIQTRRGVFTNGTYTETVLSRYIDDSVLTSADNDGPNVTLISPTVGTKFTISREAVVITRQWLGTILVGNVTLSTPRGGTFSANSGRFYSSDRIMPFSAAMNASTTGFENLINNIADSLTNSLRGISYQPSTKGQAFSLISIAVVNWYWLILPAAELVASAILLGCIVWGTGRNGLMPWTNNLLAMVFHGFDFRPRESSILDSGDEMNIEAKRLLVQLQMDEEGSRLVSMVD